MFKSAALVACCAALALAACFARTTSLGAAASDPSTGDASTAGSDGSVESAEDATAAALGDRNATGRCISADDTSPSRGCPAGQYCKSETGGCGMPGRCEPIPPPPPPVCPSLECGCDRVLRCALGSAQAGVEVAPSGWCEKPCGPHRCDEVTEYCLRGSGGPFPLDGGPGTVTYECKPLPSACAVNRSCACLVANLSIGSVTCTDTNGLMIDWPFD